MNIQCQACGTSYAVADDKVRGRLMKVRCKSCGDTIRVDGTLLASEVAQSASQAAPDAAPDAALAAQGSAASPPPVASAQQAADGAVWHIAVGESTQGPYTLDELREYYAQGSVLLDTLIYRDGYDEWRPAGEIPELAAPTQAASPLQTGALAFSGGVSMGSDPFGERSALSSAAPSPRVSAAQMLAEGESREHTVQFSLDQIRALSAAPSPANGPSAAPVMSSRMSASPSAGYAGGDGSGLIDVRKLAELHAQMSAQAQAPEENESSSLLPVHGSYAHTLAPLSLPLPPPTAQRGIDNRTKLVAGLSAFGMVLAAAVGALALLRPQVAPAAAVQPEVAAAAQPSENPALGSEITVAAKQDDDHASERDPVRAQAKPAEDEASEDADEAASDKVAASGKSSKAKSKSGGGVVAKSEKATHKAEKAEKVEKAEKSSAKDSIDDLLAAPSKPAKSSGASASASIDDLLDSAVSGKRAPPPEAKPASNLPVTPGRDDMLAALNKAKAKAAKCKGAGVATAKIQIAGSSGKATSVDVSGTDAAASSCVEKAVRSTAFPKFQKDNFEVKFPFKLAG